MTTIGMIHTTPATIDGLNRQAKEAIEDLQIINILDDSILDDMRLERNVDYVRERWIGYAKNLEKLGAAAVLSACSTVGEFAEEADRLLTIPVFRIDEAMAELAVESGENISVLATLNSTLRPTASLIERKAALADRKARLNTVLIEGAYEALMAGDKPVHDAKILEAVKKCAPQSDVIVLAQASMASAVTEDAGADRVKILTSPALGIARLKRELEKIRRD